MEHAKVTSLSDNGIFLRVLAGFAMAVLTGVGIGGTAYKLAAPGGWLAQLIGRSLPGGLGALIALLVIALCSWLLHGWMSRCGPEWYGELPVYLCAGAGVLYTLQTAMTL